MVFSVKYIIRDESNRSRNGFLFLPKALEGDLEIAKTERQGLCWRRTPQMISSILTSVFSILKLTIGSSSRACTAYPY